MPDRVNVEVHAERMVLRCEPFEIKGLIIASALLVLALLNLWRMW